MALSSLPVLASAFGVGRFTYGEIALITQFATKETDTQLAHDAVGWSMGVLRHKAKIAQLGADEARDRARAAHDDRSVRFFEGQHSGTI